MNSVTRKKARNGKEETLVAFYPNKTAIMPKHQGQYLTSTSGELHNKGLDQQKRA
jgi:hypothetical protein